jgi:hypothetical protein
VLEDGDLRYLEDRVHSAEDASISSLGSWHQQHFHCDFMSTLWEWGSSSPSKW